MLSEKVERPELVAEPFKKALDLVSDAVVITDENGNVIYQNSAAEDFHRHLDDESVSLLMKNNIHGQWSLGNPYRPGLGPNETPTVLAKQRYFERDFLVKDHDDHKVFIATYLGHPMPTSDGRPSLMIFVIKNIREVKTEKTDEYLWEPPNGRPL